MKPVKNSVVSIRLTQDEHQRIKQIATTQNTTPSKIIRQQITRLK